MNGACEVDDGADPVGRIVSELIDQFRSVGRPLRFYDVEQTLLVWAEKLRLPSEKLEEEKGLLRERLENLGLGKCALEVELRKMRDCMELSGVFLQLGWSGGVDAAERSAEEIYEAMLSKLMSGNREDLSGVVDHLRRKVKELERDLWDVALLRRKMERLECENAELKRKGDRGSWEIGELRRKVNELEVENVELRRKGQEGSGDVGQMRKMEELEKENAMLRRKVDGVSRDATELRTLKEELALANEKLNVMEEFMMASVKLKVKAERNSRDSMELRSKELVAENKELKTSLEQNVARLRWRTEGTDLQYENLKRELDGNERSCKDLEREKGVLERKNEVMQSKFDDLAQENEKLQKKISRWKKNHEESDKRVFILEKDVIGLKSCNADIVKYKDGREGHSADEKFASGSKNRNTCYAENGVGNGKHSEVIGMVLSVENRINDGVHSASLPTGDSVPISGGVVELMDSDDDTTLAGCSAKKKHSQNTRDEEHSPSSTRELKRKSNAFIDLTENGDNSKNGDHFCRSSSWTTNKKRSDQGIPVPFQNPTEQAPRSSHHH